MKKPEESRTVTVTEAAAIIGISRNLAYELARQGKLPGTVRLSRRIVVSRVALDRLLQGTDAK